MSSTILHYTGMSTPSALPEREPADRQLPLDDALEREEKNPFLVGLGARVRELRARKGMARKALAHAAGVSERHLANLEYGVGNASILVLLQVAQALQCTL
ncbi:MAG TPA: helix-turn-helix domain-containing protein, partial [Burkholderiaceae bacterium]|nr:helix-turn-helix domain-containing protein [Burkholderiaceae bacterium]